MCVKQEYIDEIINLIKIAPDECFEHSLVKNITKESVLSNTELLYKTARHYQLLLEQFRYDKFHAQASAMKGLGIEELYRIPEMKEYVKDQIFVLRSYIDLPESYVTFIEQKISGTTSTYTAELFIGIFSGETKEVRQLALSAAREKYPDIKIELSDIKVKLIN